MENKLITSSIIKNRIYTFRDMQVMLDEDLASLYGVKTKRLNEQMNRNSDRFPPEFMFQLTEKEFYSLRSQIATLDKKRGHHRKYFPYAFTEQGVAMLSSVLKSNTAIKVSIQIMNTFVAMRRFLNSNAPIFERLDIVEKKQVEHDQRFEEIFNAIQNREIIPEKGIFFEGQIFDVYKLVSDIIRTAEKSIVLIDNYIDNYIDDSVLTLLSKRKRNVTVTVFTKEFSKQILLDLNKHNAQYPPIVIKEFTQSHDRFLIIDNQQVYHFGASLKDVGKKWFAFSKFDKEAFKLLDQLGLK